MAHPYKPQVPLRNDDVYPEWETFKGTSIINVPENASSLPRKQLIDKIKGVIYGTVVANSIANDRYGSTHSAKQLTWGFGTQQMLLILDGIIRNGGEAVTTDFSTRLRYWSKFGLPETGDGSGVGGLTPALQSRMHVSTAVPNENEFVDYPEQTAKYLWDASNRTDALNTCVHRTPALGIVQFWDLEKVRLNAHHICRCTHADPRCVAASVSVSLAVAMLLQNAGSVSDVIDKACTTGGKELGNDPSLLVEWAKWAGVTNQNLLRISEPYNEEAALKAMAVGFATLSTARDFADGLENVFKFASESDPENSCVVGALLGCHFGYSQIPSDMLSSIPKPSLVARRVDNLLALMGLGDMEIEEPRASKGKAAFQQQKQQAVTQKPPQEVDTA
jgi:ADP-ribosylglycohydrolase